MIDVFEYMRLQDDGCPNTPVHVPQRPDTFQPIISLEPYDDCLILNLPIHHEDFVLTMESIRFELCYVAELVRPSLFGRHSMLKPLTGSIIVSPDEPPKVSPGGVHYPETARKQSKGRRGQVVAVGPKAEDQVEVFNVGDRVVFSDYAGSEVEEGTETYLILTWDDVLARC